MKIYVNIIQFNNCVRIKQSKSNKTRIDEQANNPTCKHSSKKGRQKLYELFPQIKSNSYSHCTPPSRTCYVYKVS